MSETLLMKCPDVELVYVRISDVGRDLFSRIADELMRRRGPLLSEETPTHDRPLAMAPLTSYRYRGPYGWIMIGAEDHAGALCEAKRSTDAEITITRLEVWEGTRYVPATL
jgi:hypothetical protein